MASGISTVLSLVDNMTAPIMGIQHAISGLEGEFKALEKAGVDTSKLTHMRNMIDMSDASARVLGYDFQRVVEAGKNATGAQDRFNDSIKQGHSAADGLAGKIGAAAAAYASIQGIKKVSDISDTLTQTTARLNMINDGQQTTKELQDKIFLAAERARGSYSATADTVAKLGTLAGSAFSSNDEIIAFAEQMNKQFVIGGASVQEQTSAMYQLTQAMAAGKLQGDEFRSIMENAPLLAQSIADRMGKTTGELKEMSSQGLITADIIKSSLFAAADETNAKFEQMPMTFGQIWTSISNQALLAFQPFLDKLNEIANSPAFQSLVDGVISAVQMLGSIAIPILNAILAVGRAIYNFIAANIQPIMIVLITLLVIFGAQAIAAGISAFVSFLMATWPLLLIIAIVALVILAINKLGVSFEVIFAKIGEIVGVAIASIVNIFIDLWNFLAGFVNMFARIFDDPVAGIIGLFVEMFTFILNILSRVAKVIDTIFGTGISDAISGFGDRVTGWYNDTFGPTEEFVAKMEPIDADEWGAKGANIGGGIGAFMDNPDMGSLFPSNIPNASDYGTGFDFSGIESGVGNIDANTKQSADFSEEELKLWRDIAERDVVNSFTTAEVTVDFGGITNNVASEIDLDGIIDYLADGIEETLFEVAEGVHA